MKGLKMNRRDAALIAHLDAIEARISGRFDNIDRRLDTIVDAIADRHIADGHGGEE